VDLFVTGTDTGVGKTLCSAALLLRSARRGERCCAMKPVASGCTCIDGQLKSPDAEYLNAHANAPASYAEVNPYAFADPIAPHLAAGDRGVEISLLAIGRTLRDLARERDRIIVEGVGGWCVPLGKSLMLADLVRSLDVGVLLVVGMRLGCINHALLTADRIRADGCHLLGWVSNGVDADMARSRDNRISLERRMPAPCLGHIPWLRDPGPELAADYLRLPDESTRAEDK